MLKEHENLCKSLASRYKAPGISVEDLEQEALLAALEHIPKYTPQMKVSLETFLGRRIRNALEKFKNQVLGLTEMNREWYARHVSGEEDLEIRAKSKEECDSKVKVKGYKFYSKPRRTNNLVSKIVSLSEEIGSDEMGEPFTRLDLVPGDEPSPDASLLKQDKVKVQKKVLDNRMEEIQERARLQGEVSRIETVVKMREAGLTQMQISKKLGISQKRVSVLLAKLKVSDALEGN